jgi:hypothetical protein
MSKKIVSILAALAAGSILFMSCGSAPAAKPEAGSVTAPIVGKEGVPQPAWVNKTPKSAETFFAIGYGKMSNKQNSILRAESDAKDQISRWVTTSVKAAVTNYVNESGEGDNRQVLDYLESISKQVTDQSLAGVERDEVWVDAEGGVYVLCSFPKANVGKSFEQVSGNFVRNEAAAFAEFKAKEALSFLDKETAKDDK